RWIEKSATRVAMDSQGMYGDQRCVTTSSPSQADMMEWDGVMTPSHELELASALLRDLAYRHVWLYDCGVQAVAVGTWFQSD
ncbi:MAG: hypothetical protein WCI05_18125, partial [Myxococcales bacterium]